jgi:hypothetical protein
MEARRVGFEINGNVDNYGQLLDNRVVNVPVIH